MRHLPRYVALSSVWLAVVTILGVPLDLGEIRTGLVVLLVCAVIGDLTRIRLAYYETLLESAQRRAART